MWQREIEEMMKDQDKLIVEKARLWDDIACLEQAVSVAIQEVPWITAYMDTEAKGKRLRDLITQLKCNIKDMHVVVNKGTPLEQAPEWKIIIEDLAM